jgi:transcriptional antiterminator RfaH
VPILPKEPDVYPDTLLADCEAAAPDGREWFAIYTIARREKDFMRRLRQMAIPHYGPLIKRRSRSPSGRVRHSYVPLFPGYVFLLADAEQRQQAYTTNCISRCLPIPDVAQLVHDLRQIQGLIQLDAPLTPEARIQPGMLVRIKSGSMAGTEGTVIKRHGHERLVVAVTFLQQGASVLLEDVQLERLY